MSGDRAAAGAPAERPSGAVPERVDKLMSADRAEVARSWSELRAALGVPPGGLDDAIPVGSGRVEIAAAPQSPVRLGGLLELPRTIVSLRFESLSAGERASFLAAFDRAFQRGGG